MDIVAFAQPVLLRGVSSAFSSKARCARHGTIRMGPGKPRAPRARTRDPTEGEERDDPWSTDKMGFLEVGVVVGAHGVRGEAKVRAATDFGRQRLGADAAASGKRFMLMPGRRYPRPVEIFAGRKATQHDTWIIKVETVNSRAEVDAIRGARIFVRQVERPRMSRDEFMVGDLVGMRVARVGTPDLIVGVVRGVITREDLCEASGGGAASAAVAADLLELAMYVARDDTGQGEPLIDRDDGPTTLIPFVKQLVPHIDRQRRVLLIDPHPGLLEIAEVNNKYKPPPPRGLLCAARDAENGLGFQ
jgi:16S rRNA processing protein RimM